VIRICSPTADRPYNRPYVPGTARWRGRRAAGKTRGHRCRQPGRGAIGRCAAGFVTLCARARAPARSARLRSPPAALGLLPAAGISSATRSRIEWRWARGRGRECFRYRPCRRERRSRGKGSRSTRDSRYMRGSVRWARVVSRGCRSGAARSVTARRHWPRVRVAIPP
jgi:hypothetical protein